MHSDYTHLHFFGRLMAKVFASLILMNPVPSSSIASKMDWRWATLMNSSAHLSSCEPTRGPGVATVESWLMGVDNISGEGARRVKVSSALCKGVPGANWSVKYSWRAKTKCRALTLPFQLYWGQWGWDFTWVTLRDAPLLSTNFASPVRLCQDKFLLFLSRAHRIFDLVMGSCG